MAYSPFRSFGAFSAFSAFSIIPFIVLIGFMFFIGIIVAKALRGASQWKKNNDSPVLTVEAKVVAKRADVSHFNNRNMNSGSMSYTSSSTTYFVTFQVQSGDRMEFLVQDTEYGMLVENDFGKLTFQGTRYIGFERGRSPSY
jgi:Protein of unknown function (DUF2500).